MKIILLATIGWLVSSARQLILLNKCKRFAWISVLIFASGARANQEIVLTFEGLGNNQSIGQYYNGGTSGDGRGPGPNYGIYFSDNALSLISTAAGGSGNFGGEPSPNTIMFFSTGSAATMNVPAGFRDGFSFYYSAPYRATQIHVYSGLNATGQLLATLDLPLTPEGPDDRAFSPFIPIGVSFEGIARSVDFAGTQNQCGFDNITLGRATPGGLWSDSIDYGGGLKWSPWFGWYNDSHAPWYWHYDGMEWCYISGGTADNIVMWVNTMQDWIYTQTSWFPFLYRFSDNAYLWYYEGTSEPQWYHNYQTGRDESFPAAPRVLLLLHGMNSSPNSWNDFVQNQFSGSAPSIQFGENISFYSPVSNDHGVVCYRVDFGYFDDRLGLSGVGDPTPRTFRDSDILEPAMGDFTTFDYLGLEVEAAIHYILEQHPGAEIVLLGHSRGGLAARAFLQNSSGPERDAVIALITTGTPHRGSPLGRVYRYLEEHPRENQHINGSARDWQVVDFLLEPVVFGIIRPDISLDVRKPTVDHLADNSIWISWLNNGVNRLPRISYGTIEYSGHNIGHLSRSVNYNIFTWFVGAPTVTTQAQNFILGEGNSPSTFPGDGIVPFNSQGFKNLIPWWNPSYQEFKHVEGGVLHIEQTNEIEDITDALKALVDWWN